MSQRQAISTDKAPGAIGPYSQAIRAGGMVYLSGQIPLAPGGKDLVSDDIGEQTRQVFANLAAVAEAANASLADAAKLTIYLTDLSHFATVNEIMAELLSEPFPARATIEVSALPKGAAIEIDAVLLG